MRSAGSDRKAGLKIGKLAAGFWGSAALERNVMHSCPGGGRRD